MWNKQTKILSVRNNKRENCESLLAERRQTEAVVCPCGHLVMFEGAVDQQRRLLLHPLGHSVGHTVVRLGAGLSGRNTVLIVHVLLGWPKRGWKFSNIWNRRTSCALQYRGRAKLGLAPGPPLEDGQSLSENIQIRFWALLVFFHLILSVISVYNVESFRSTQWFCWETQTGFIKMVWWLRD